MTGIWLVVAAMVGEGVAFYKFQDEVFGVLLKGATIGAEGRAIQARLQDDSRMVDQIENQVKELMREQADIAHSLDELERLVTTDTAGPKNSPEMQGRLAAIKTKKQMYDALEKRIATHVEVVRKRLEDRRESSAAHDKDAAQLAVIRNQTATLGIGVVVIGLLGFFMSVVGFFLAWSGLSEWRVIQKAQDAFLRRQWDATSSVPPT